MPPNTVYVGRGSKWGNQFYVAPEKVVHNPPEQIGDLFACKTAREAVKKYKQTNIGLWKLRCDFRIKNIKKELKGKNLACWCPLDQPCHADVLLEIANK